MLFTFTRPLILILYVNNLLKCLPKDSISSFADDTVKFSADDFWMTIQDRLEALLEKVTSWPVFFSNA